MKLNNSEKKTTKDMIDNLQGVIAVDTYYGILTQVELDYMNDIITRLKKSIKGK